MRFELVVFAAVAVAATSGCRDPFAPPPGSRAFDPPPVYRTLWQEVEDCSGLHGDFDRVRWFVFPQSFFWCGDETCAGVWHVPHDIYLSEVAQSDSGGHYFTVRHEMLHDLLAGGADHPPVFSTCGLSRRWTVEVDASAPALGTARRGIEARVPAGPDIGTQSSLKGKAALTVSLTAEIAAFIACSAASNPSPSSVSRTARLAFARL